jgi:hypothetical protein
MRGLMMLWRFVLKQKIYIIFKSHHQKLLMNKIERNAFWEIILSIFFALTNFYNIKYIISNILKLFIYI